MAKHRKTQSERAGLKFPVGRIKRYLRETAGSKRISSKAAVALAASMEYLVHEVLDATCQVMGHDNPGKLNERIKPKYLHKAIQNDHELNLAFGSAIFPQSSFIPHFTPEQPKSIRRARKKKTKHQVPLHNTSPPHSHSFDESAHANDATHYTPHRTHKSPSKGHSSHHSNASQMDTTPSPARHRSSVSPKKRPATKRLSVKVHRMTTDHTSPESAHQPNMRRRKGSSIFDTPVNPKRSKKIRKTPEHLSHKTAPRSDLTLSDDAISE